MRTISYIINSVDGNHRWGEIEIPGDGYLTRYQIDLVRRQISKAQGCTMGEGVIICKIATSKVDEEPNPKMFHIHLGDKDFHVNMVISGSVNLNDNVRRLVKLKAARNFNCDPDRVTICNMMSIG